MGTLREKHSRYYALLFILDTSLILASHRCTCDVVFSEASSKISGSVLSYPPDSSLAPNRDTNKRKVGQNVLPSCALFQEEKNEHSLTSLNQLRIIV